MSDRRLPRVPGPVRALLLVVIAGLVGRAVSQRMTTGDDDSDEVRRVAILGGSEFDSRAAAFRSAAALAVLGGIEIDLRQAQLDPGGAALDLTALLGGIEVTVPSGWAVEVELGGKYGGIDDRLDQGAPTPEDAPVLRITANAWLGGIELRRA